MPGVHRVLHQAAVTPGQDGTGRGLGPGLPVVLSFPLPGSWRVQNSPANQVPSHGTDAFGSSHAIDLVPVDERGRSAPRSWRGLLSHEPPEVFVGFGRPILAPVSGRVEAVHDGEPDHEGRRSQLTLVPYMLGQARRARRGPVGLAGNHGKQHVAQSRRPKGGDRVLRRFNDPRPPQSPRTPTLPRRPRDQRPRRRRFPGAPAPPGRWFPILASRH